MKKGNSLMSIIFSIGVGFFSFFALWVIAFVSLLLLGRLTIFGEGMAFLLVIVFGFAIATIIGIVGFMFGFRIGNKFWNKHFNYQPKESGGAARKTNSKLVKIVVFLPFAAIAIYGTWFFVEFAFRSYIFGQKDPAACYRLGNNSVDVKNCYMGILKTADKYEYCFPTNIELNEKETSSCLLSVAIRTKNPDICQEVIYDHFGMFSPVDNQNNCYESVVHATKDTSICERLTPTVYRPNVVSECKSKTF